MKSEHINLSKQRFNQSRNWYEGCDDLDSAFHFAEEREELIKKTKNASFREVELLREVRT